MNCFWYCQTEEYKKKILEDFNNFKGGGIKMENITLGIIYTFKTFGTNKAKSVLLDFLSEYTNTPKEHYSQQKLIRIIRSAFADYIRFCDNPGYEIYSYFDAKRYKEDLKVYNYKLYKEYQESEDIFDDDTQALIITLCNTQVKELDKKTKNYKYINGFHKADGFLKEVLDKLEKRKEESF